MISRAQLAVLLAFIELASAETSTPNTGDLPQAFLFSYSTGPLTLPLLPSCPGSLTIPGTSSLTTPDTSDPIAPYTLTMLVHEQLEDGAGIRYERMYARSQNVGDMSRPWSVNVPWMNGTQMIGCMWAANGVSGGCQDLMTVASTSQTNAAYANATSECRVPSIMGSWVTPPSSTLDVKVEHPVGELASNGWPAACSDIRVTPRNGTAPYTLLVAPAFHPPVNITGTESMNYTVRLTHGQAFMLGVFDSAGNSFAFGPLHAGRSAELGCLAVATGKKLPVLAGGVAVGALAGGIVGAFVVGAIGGALVLWGLCIKRRDGRGARRTHALLPSPDEQPNSKHRPVDLGDTSFGSYLNPKPLDLDPYVDSPDPDRTYTSSHQLPYGSRSTRHTSATFPGPSGAGGDISGGGLYDPYVSPLPRPSPALAGDRPTSMSSSTWPGIASGGSGGGVGRRQDEFGSMGGPGQGGVVTASASLPVGSSHAGLQGHRDRQDTARNGGHSDNARLRLIGTPTSDAFDAASLEHHHPHRRDATNRQSMPVGVNEKHRPMPTSASSVALGLGTSQRDVRDGREGRDRRDVHSRVVSDESHLTHLTGRLHRQMSGGSHHRDQEYDRDGADRDYGHGHGHVYEYEYDHDCERRTSAEYPQQHPHHHRREHSTSPPHSSRRPRNVYVVHSDAGPGEDVHIRLPPTVRDARVIEMPPDYRHDLGPVGSPERQGGRPGSGGLSGGLSPGIGSIPGQTQGQGQGQGGRASSVLSGRSGVGERGVSFSGAGAGAGGGGGGENIHRSPDSGVVPLLSLTPGIEDSDVRSVDIAWLAAQGQGRGEGEGQESGSRFGSGADAGMGMGALTPELRARAEAAMAEKSRH